MTHDDFCANDLEDHTRVQGGIEIMEGGIGAMMAGMMIVLRNARSRLGGDGAS